MREQDCRGGYSSLARCSPSGDVVSAKRAIGTKRGYARSEGEEIRRGGILEASRVSGKRLRYTEMGFAVGIEALHEELDEISLPSKCQAGRKNGNRIGEGSGITAMIATDQHERSPPPKKEYIKFLLTFESYFMRMIY